MYSVSFIDTDVISGRCTFNMPKCDKFYTDDVLVEWIKWPRHFKNYLNKFSVKFLFLFNMNRRDSLRVRILGFVSLSFIKLWLMMLLTLIVKAHFD